MANETQALNLTSNVSSASVSGSPDDGDVVVVLELQQHAEAVPNPNAVLVLYLVLVRFFQAVLKGYGLDPLVAKLLVVAAQFTLIGAQLGLVVWKKKHKRSYEAVTLLGLWMIPLMFSWHLHFWRFIAIWTFYSLSIAYLLALCTRPTLDPTTPRNVFSWFLIVHKLCIAVGGVGYATLLMEVLGLAPLIWLIIGRGTSIILLWYGLYFGVLGRDCAELVSDRMAAKMGYGQKLSVTPNNCGLCQKDLNDFSHMGGEKPAEATFQLACKHTFHELCIKGWTMVGKKDVCPVCMEKVDLKLLYADRPWETRNLNWISMLDAVRYCVCWLPIILAVLHFAMHFAGLDKNPNISPPPLPGLSSPPLPELSPLAL